ncbi:hypothetical protein PDQ79_31375 [Bacillus cereus]|nr:hypothetical protein [Bacillus cereus]
MTDGEIFKGMEHEKSIFDTKHKKMVLLLIELARLYDEVDNFQAIESVLGRE